MWASLSKTQLNSTQLNSTLAVIPAKCTGQRDSCVRRNDTLQKGFTLIELSIVLVIIGLIIGGILVGVDLVSAATIRSQVTQIEKYRTAVNTFKGKYGELPGDMEASVASQFGFISRGPCPGQGDNDGLIEGTGHPNDSPCTSSTMGHTLQQNGEALLFWGDLGTAGFIDFKSPITAFNPNIGSNVSVATMLSYFPPAKIRQGGIIYVYSGGTDSNTPYNIAPAGYNYFGINSPIAMNWGMLGGIQVLKVSEAYAIDSKMDDGLPQSGSVMAMYEGGGFGYGRILWSAGGFSTTSQSANYIGAYNSTNGGPTTNATVGTSYTCYDNSTSSDGQTASNGNAQHYSVEMQSGNNINCNLSFQFQ